MPNVKVKPVRIYLSDKGEREKITAAARIIEEMNKAGFNGYGEPFPDGITMHDSGRLHSDFNAFSTRINYNAPYANRWQKQFHWCDIPTSGPWRDRYEQEVQKILNKEVKGN